MNTTLSYDPTLRKILTDLHKKLMVVYGDTFTYFSTKDALSELISAMLSHRTKNAITRKAYQKLRGMFTSWEEVMNGSVEKITEAIEVVTYPEQKAYRIKEVLRLINEENEGRLSLDFIADMKARDARQWLEKLPGVGAKTSAAVLNFSKLRMRALVVDTHHQRVAQRLGLVAQKAPISKIAWLLEDHLPEEWDAQQVYDHHQLFMRHGQKCCYYKNPDCNNCILKSDCHYFLNKYKDQQQ